MRHRDHHIDAKGYQDACGETEMRIDVSDKASTWQIRRKKGANKGSAGED